MKNKSRWIRIELSDILKNKELFADMLEKRKNGNYWPYLCGDSIKWKCV